MELSPPSEAANCAAVQEFPKYLWKPKVHYHVHKISLLVTILNHIDPVYITLSNFSNIHFNIIHPTTS
jgi:hypothetical protein